MSEEPLHEWELKVVRGMIDDHRYKEDRAKFVRGFWTTGKLWAASIAGLLFFVTQLVTLVMLARRG